MSIKSNIKMFLKAFQPKDSSIVVKTTPVCECEKDTDSTKLLTKIITLKSPIEGAYAAESHGLDYNKIRGYTVVLNMNDYHWLLPNSNEAGAMYDAWVSTQSVALKVDPKKTITRGRTVHFIINYLP